MWDAAPTTDGNMTDPLRTAADAVALAARAAREGVADAQARASGALPHMNRIFNRLTYSSFYAISYGVVFPTMMLVGSLPQDHKAVQGLIEGGAAARDAATRLRRVMEASHSRPRTTTRIGD
jgi:hypothetical protein